MTRSATAIAHPNIALIKYWGNYDEELRLPSNGSISLTLGTLETQTTVTFRDELRSDQATINGRSASDASLTRISAHLDRIRLRAGIEDWAQVDSQNNFPTGVGIASSASAFAALTLAATTAAGLTLDPESLSRIARTGSGSACRSIYGGYVEWFPGQSDQESIARPLADPDHWQLFDIIAVVNREHKEVGSSAGHARAETSPLQAARVKDTPRRLGICRDAIRAQDFASLAAIVELDSNLMHAVMLTSKPALVYWSPGTIEVMHAVRNWRNQGLEVCYTIDAGPNVHCICTPNTVEKVVMGLSQITSVQEIIKALPGGPAVIVGSS
jgi:diphosphomevalonate decarboxylase